MIRLIRTAMALPGVDRQAAELRRAPPDWQARQNACIRDIVRHAYRSTPFYRRAWDAAGINPRAIRGAADLPALPIVGQMEWRLAPNSEMLATGLRGPLFWYHTGGTTGAPLHLPYTLRDDAAMTAGMLAVLRLNGVRWRDLMRPRPPLPTSVTAPVRRVGGLLYLNRGLSQADVLALLESGRFPLVRCMPGSAWRAAIQARREGRKLPPLRLLICGAEVLTGPVRRALAEALSTRVVNHYGTTEFGHIATECAASRQHLFWHSVYVEILSGDRPAAPGETGEVVITSFVSHGRPIVRVRTGDLAAWSSDPCPCGNPAPTLAYMAGRKIDQIFTPDGRAITWPLVEQTLSPLGENLLGFQAEQVTAGRVIVRLSLAVPPASLDEARASLQDLFGGLACDIELTDDFNVEAGKKTRWVIGLAAENG
jgi:phenylacetate-coenzyme A ligase PaaK-like adenylate-forming protein